MLILYLTFQGKAVTFSIEDFIHNGAEEVSASKDLQKGDLIWFRTRVTFKHGYAGNCCGLFLDFKESVVKVLIAQDVDHLTRDRARPAGASGLAGTIFPMYITTYDIVTCYRLCQVQR